VAIPDEKLTPWWRSVLGGCIGDLAPIGWGKLPPVCGPSGSVCRVM